MIWILYATIAAADGPPMSLVIDPLNPHSPVDIGVYQAMPGARVLLVRSDGGVGRGQAVVGGPRLGIRPGSGYEIILDKRADANGFAQWHVPSFPDVPDGDWWFQAIVIAGNDSQTSHVLHRPVFVDERRLDDAAEPDNDEATATWVVDNGVYPRRACDNPDMFMTELAPGEAITADFARRHSGPTMTLRAGEDLLTTRGTSHLSWRNEGDEVVEVSIQVGPVDACQSYTLHTRQGPVETCVPPLEGSSPDHAFAVPEGSSYETTQCPGTERWFTIPAPVPGRRYQPLAEGPGPFQSTSSNSLLLPPDALGRPRPVTVRMSSPTVDASERTATLLEEGLQNLVLLGEGLHYLDVPIRDARWTRVSIWGSHVPWGGGPPVQWDSAQRPAIRTFNAPRSFVELDEAFDGVVSPTTVLVEFTTPVDCDNAPAVEPLVLGHAGEVWTEQANCGQPQVFRIDVPEGTMLESYIDQELRARGWASRQPNDDGTVDVTVHPDVFPFHYTLRTHLAPAPVLPPVAPPNLNSTPLSAIPIEIGERVQTSAFDGDHWYILHVPQPGTFMFEGRDLTFVDLSGVPLTSTTGNGRTHVQLDANTFIRAPANTFVEAIRTSNCPGFDRDEPLTQPLRGDLCPGQTHRFTFDAQAGDTWSYTVDGLGLMDVRVELPDGSVTPVGTHEGWFVSRSGVWQAQQTGVHRLVLASQRPSTSVTSLTSFSLDWDPVTTAPCLPDALEPNDQRDQASPMATGDGIVCAFDKDWYEIEVYAGDYLNITVEGDVRATYEGLPARWRGHPFTVQEDTTMAVRVEHGGTPRGGVIEPESYTLTLIHDTCVGQDPEGNTTADASTLSVGDTYAGTLCPSDVDTFLVSLPDDWFPGRPGPGFEVQIEELGEPAGRIAHHVFETEDGYAVAIVGSIQAGPSRAYSLTLVDTRVSCLPDAYEPNDTPETAAAIGPGQHLLTTCGDDDYFSVFVPAHHGLQVRGLDYGYAAYEAPYGWGDKLFVETDTEILLQADDSLLDVDILPPCSLDGFEPNSLRYLAAALQPGHHVGQLCLPRYFDQDWYRVDLQAGEHLALHLEFDNLETDLKLELFDRRRTRLAISDWAFQPFESLTWVAPADQTVFVRVRQAEVQEWFIQPGDNYDLSYDLYVDTVP